MEDFSHKSTVDEIRERFDKDVERFSNLQSGQTTTVDAALVMDLITRAAAANNPNAADILDIGCGAGNYAIKLLSLLPVRSITLVDLSKPMLDRAVERLRPLTAGSIKTRQGDIRHLPLGDSCFDIILAAAVFHHLRDETEWQDVFSRLYTSLKPGGSLWISDLIKHDTHPIHNLMWARYGEYLAQLKDEAFRDYVFAYIAREDTPRSLLFQIDLLRQVGFTGVEILHKNSCFAAFGVVKPPDDPQSGNLLPI